MDKGAGGATEKRDLSIPDGFVEAPDPWPVTGFGEIAVVVPMVQQYSSRTKNCRLLACGCMPLAFPDIWSSRMILS